MLCLKNYTRISPIHWIFISERSPKVYNIAGVPLCSSKSTDTYPFTVQNLLIHSARYHKLEVFWCSLLNIIPFYIYRKFTHENDGENIHTWLIISMVFQGDRTTKLRNRRPLLPVPPITHFKIGIRTPAISNIDVNVFSNIKTAICNSINKNHQNDVSLKRNIIPVYILPVFRLKTFQRIFFIL